MAVPLDFVWILVEIIGLPVALSTVATTRMVTETIETVLQVDNGGFQRSRVSSHQPVRLDHRIKASSDDVLLVTYKYEQLLGCCRTYAMINYGG